MSSWRVELAQMLQRGSLIEARALIEAATKESPADAEPWRALMEVAAAQDDYVGCRLALAYFLQACRTATPPLEEDLEPIWLAGDDIRLKIAQLWMSHDGRNRLSGAFLYRALESFPWFVPPPPSVMSDEAAYARDGARLIELTEEFEPMKGELSLWRDWIHPSDIQTFRGEFCLSQAGCHDPSNFGPVRLLQAYTLALEYAQSHDDLGALEQIDDDGAFHGLRFIVDGRVVSFDMIDCTMTLNFLARHCGLKRSDPVHLLDIGAGWGRLVDRFLELFPEGFAHALDAVPFTSFCAERYLRHRGLSGRAVIGSRRALESVAPGTIHIATNVHSWSEVPLASIEAWLDALDRVRVRFLFFVPHGLPAVSMEREGPGKLIVPAIIAHGWRVIVEQPKYGASLQRQQSGLYPTAHYYLFEKMDLGSYDAGDQLSSASDL